ncbi:hypothetical protein F8388_019478 [Cannabis sativa]|uniref:Reverse transcriptase zinc-binding domain-containing protein n=1 Tax=Cannabis sativa TaxID=3483 RepID=A0A7J6EPM8_CANSA|nr:hypothetical protein F8388_019478 [Cannabis sativa]
MHSDDVPWILGIPINTGNTVGSGYTLTQKEKHETETSNKMKVQKWWKEVWQSNLTPKMKNFVWRVCHNWVPTKSELGKRGINLDGTCSGCWNKIETIGHALWCCPRLKPVWKTAGFWHLFPESLGLMTDLMEFLMYMRGHCTKQEFESFLGLSWMVWNHRNKQIFQNNKTPLKHWIPWAVDYVAHALQRKEMNLNVKTEKERKSWQAPPTGTFLLNCDAALKKEQEGFATAAVIRNEKGQLIAAEACFHPGYATVLMAECLAIKMGMKLVQYMDSKPFIASSDNQSAVHQITTKRTPRADWVSDGCKNLQIY